MPLNSPFILPPHTHLLISYLTSPPQKARPSLQSFLRNLLFSQLFHLLITRTPIDHPRAVDERFWTTWITAFAYFALAVKIGAVCCVSEYGGLGFEELRLLRGIMPCKEEYSTYQEI